MYVSPYGKPDGITDRLKKWADDLGKDRTFPWAGLGLIADLQTAAALLEGRPAPTMEFDL